jgi:hypothetical protein
MVKQSTNINKREFKQWWSNNLPISTKRTTTSNLNYLETCRSIDIQVSVRGCAKMWSKPPIQNNWICNDYAIYTIDAWMFCFVEDNKILSGIVITIKQPPLSGVVDRATIYCLPLHYICLDCLPGCLPPQHIIRMTLNDWLIGV